MSKSPVLARARRLRAGYGEVEILHGLSFALPAAGISALVGPGGSGKTTLLRLLAPAGEEPPPWRRGALELAVRRAFFLPQPRIPRPVAGGGPPLDLAAREERLGELLEEDWELLVLDEPADVLAEEARLRLAVSLRARDPARPVLLATHNLQFLRAVADHVFFLIDGRLIEAAAAEDFFERPRRERTRSFLRSGS